MSVYFNPLVDVLVLDTDSFQVIEITSEHPDGLVEVSSGYPDEVVVLESPIEIEPYSSIEIWTRSSSRDS